MNAYSVVMKELHAQYKETAILLTLYDACYLCMISDAPAKAIMNTFPDAHQCSDVV